MLNSGSGPIFVTGASGWVGRTVIDQLSQLLPPEDFRERLRAFSSQASLIHLADGQSIATQPLTSLPALAEKEGCSFLLHAAFLTPDRCAEIGHEKYTAINRSITKLVETSVRTSSTVRVVQFSSGAAALAETNQSMGSASMQIYGALKLDEERRLQEIAPTLVLRIFALSGRYIRDPWRYALGDFVGQALAGKSIQIHSHFPVVRGYVHADCLAKLAIYWLFSHLAAPSEPVNAVTHEVSLLDLAHIVATIFDDLCVYLPELVSDNPDVYTASPKEFWSMLKLLSIDVPSLDCQIRDTALSDSYRKE
jgi:nucleoside-diphosphate-sugar epimerase